MSRPVPVLPVTGAGVRGLGAPRPVPANANAVPTRQAATACMVLLAGRRVDDRPVIRALTSSTTQTVIQAQRIQARTTAPVRASGRPAEGRRAVATSLPSDLVRRRRDRVEGQLRWTGRWARRQRSPPARTSKESTRATAGSWRQQARYLCSSRALGHALDIHR